jgi:hypothetical protein
MWNNYVGYIFSHLLDHKQSFFIYNNFGAYNYLFCLMTKKIEHHQSKSLWNYTLSPGWKPEEVQILKLALQKFGVGKWRRIVKSKCLPGKSIGQIYMQTQRLVGQQSLGDFMGLHLNL